MITERRRGYRPETTTEGPHRQLNQLAPPEIWGRLVWEVFALPNVIEAHSKVSPATSRAVYLTDLVEELSPQTSLAPGHRLEPVHLHGVEDTSIHLCLPASRGRELVELGWAEPHQFEEFGTEFMIYGPRDRDEVAVVLSIIEESLEFARSSSG